MSSRNWVAALVLVAAMGPDADAAALAQESARGWIGIRIWCENCLQEVDGAVVWQLSNPPVITEVMPGGPADRAGLHVGDTLVAVDRVAVSSDRGARRLGMLRAGTPVEFLVRREGAEHRIRLVPAPHRQALDASAGVRNVEEWESLRAQMRMLFDEHQELSRALRRAEQLWRMTNDDRVRQWADSQQQVVGRFRLEIDSMRQDLLSSHRRLADTLALRTLYIRPNGSDPLAVDTGTERAVPAPSMMPIRAYLNAVAGARFQELGPELSHYFDVQHGLLVLEVASGTPAEMAGLLPGDVILSVNADDVHSIGDLRQALKKDREVQLEIMRKGERRLLAMRSP